MKSGGGNSTVVHMHVQGGSMRIRVSKTRCMLIAITLIMVFSLAGFSFAVSAEEETENDSGHTEKIPVKVLILPKFEVGELSGDFSVPFFEFFAAQNSPILFQYPKQRI
jgi:hypothetical protein